MASRSRCWVCMQYIVILDVVQKDKVSKSKPAISLGEMVEIVVAALLADPLVYLWEI